MMEAAGFQVEQSSDSLNGSRKENESDKEKEKEKEREIESSKGISQSGGEYSQCQTPHHWASRTIHRFRTWRSMWVR